MYKHPLSLAKLRQLPKQFSWVDQRLVGDRYTGRLSHSACALYLFLITVADAQGLSFYSDRSVCHRLSMSQSDLHKARKELTHHALLAYQKPLYQVLALDDANLVFAPQTPRMTAEDKPMPIKDIFKHIAETLS